MLPPSAAAKIIGVLEKRKHSLRAPDWPTGVGAAEFLRIRNARLVRRDRIDLDRMTRILGKLDRIIEALVHVRPSRSSPRKRDP
jgi:hypothetical protein